MKATSFYYPYDAVFKLLQIILTRKGFTIVSVNKDEGVIHARCERMLFTKGKTLDIKIEKINHNTTDIILMVNANSKVYEKPITDDEHDEEKLLDAIYKSF